MPAKDLTIGAQFRVREDGKFIEDAYTVKAIDRSRLLKVETHTQYWLFGHTQYWLFGPEERLLVQSKTIESTIEQIRAVADVCGIREAVFCPVMDGEILYSLIYDSQSDWRSMMVIQEDCWKPGPGMLNYLKSLRTFGPRKCVIVGDQPRDRAAADAADSEFIDADDWRRDLVTV